MPTHVSHAPVILRDAPIPTWFGVGGRADRLCQPVDGDQLRACLDIDPEARILGDGANLLVDDAGVAELVVELSAPYFTSFEIDAASGVVSAGAGVKLPRLINEAVRAGLGGIEGLAGIPASLGGAIVMNAGGAFGQISDVVGRVHALDRTGVEVDLERDQIAFAYRESGLTHLIITRVELHLRPGEPESLRARQLEVMEYKSRTQPLKDRSAGCVFRNPTLARPVHGVGGAGERVSAGRLIDLAGCKGTRIGGATVSHAHGNFIVAEADAAARDIIRLMSAVQRRVYETHGVRLEPEVVVWEREA